MWHDGSVVPGTKRRRTTAMSAGTNNLEPKAGEDKSAQDLLPLVYEELRKLAAARMANGLGNWTLQPTALVHEAWLRLVGPEHVLLSPTRPVRAPSHVLRTTQSSVSTAPVSSPNCTCRPARSKQNSLPQTCGRVAEWLKAPDSKSGVGVTQPGVRIPPLPPI
jgi:hypothetical protein